MSTATESEESTQYLSFFIGDEEYGLRILESREIIQYPAVTKVPSMPPAIRGVINLRGSVVPVVDLSVLFGSAERPLTKWTCVLVVEADQRKLGARKLVGIVVDSVSQVIDLKPDEIEDAPAFGTLVKRHFLKGMGKTHAKKFVLILDLENVLSDAALHSTDVRAGPEGESAAGLANSPEAPSAQGSSNL